VTDFYLPWAKNNHTASHYQSDVWRTKVLIAEFGKLRLDELSTFAVERFKKRYRAKKTKRGEQRKPASVNRCLQLLSKIVSLALAEKLLREDQRPAISLLREDNHRLRYLIIEEERQWLPILADGWPYLRDIVVVALATGLRKSELLRLEKSHVGFATSLIHVLDTKSGKLRAVPKQKRLTD
jgi:site-specific recombinase XerD